MKISDQYNINVNIVRIKSLDGIIKKQQINTNTFKHNHKDSQNEHTNI